MSRVVGDQFHPLRQCRRCNPQVIGSDQLVFTPQLRRDSGVCSRRGLIHRQNLKAPSIAAQAGSAISLKPSANSPATVHEMHAIASVFSRKKPCALSAPRFFSCSRSIKKQVSNRSRFMPMDVPGFDPLPAPAANDPALRHLPQASLPGNPTNHRRSSPWCPTSPV